MQELCQGSLFAFLTKAKPIIYDQGGALRLETVASLLRDICEGMVYLHARGIVHGGGWGSSRSTGWVGQARARIDFQWLKVVGYVIVVIR